MDIDERLDLTVFVKIWEKCIKDIWGGWLITIIVVGRELWSQWGEEIVFNYNKSPSQAIENKANKENLLITSKEVHKKVHTIELQVVNKQSSPKTHLTPIVNVLSPTQIMLRHLWEVWAHSGGVEGWDVVCYCFVGKGGEV